MKLPRAVRCAWPCILLFAAPSTAVTLQHSTGGNASDPTDASTSWGIETLQQTPLEFRLQFQPETPPPYPMAKRPGHYTASDWAQAIDSVWGPGLPYADKLSIWQTCWDSLNQRFVNFNGLDVTLWDSIYARYNAEIVDTVSCGRFDAILQHATRALHEAHTSAADGIVVGTRAEPGVPIVYGHAWGTDAHFGAGLTPQSDSSLLVYDVVAGHPLGLEAGDRVLGYDRIPWHQLCNELLDAELPIKGSCGSSPESYTHKLLMSAGRNWHLFDTIDVVKYATGDTLHLPTTALAAGVQRGMFTEQLDIPGVPKPDWSTSNIASWGMIEGTTIAYLYIQGWYWDAGTIFTAVADSILNHYFTTGLIVDFRLNYGGNMFLAYPALAMLCDEPFRSVIWYQRCSPWVRMPLCLTAQAPMIQADSATYYDKPIAVLTGPGAVSSGDEVALMMAFHPMTRFFGKSTDGAFNAPVLSSLHPTVSFNYAYTEASLSTNPGVYLTRSEFPRDYPWVPFTEVWLTPDGVAGGRDDVVDSARHWILSLDLDQDGFPNAEDNCQALATPENEPVLTGDVNTDGDLTSSDVIWLVNYTFKSGMAPLPVADAGDTNCDSKVDASDIIYMVNHLFKSGSEPCDVCALPR